VTSSHWGIQPTLEHIWCYRQKVGRSDCPAHVASLTPGRPQHEFSNLDQDIARCISGFGASCSPAQKAWRPGVRAPDLEVDHVSAQAVEGFLECFGQCGMGVNIAHKLAHSEVPLLGEGELGK
jgi:hypothetical protein